MLGKRVLTYVFAVVSAVVLGAAVAAPAFANDAPRFSAEGFLEEWKAFLEDETKAAKKDQVPGNLDFNIGGTAQKSDSEFLFFKKPEANGEAKPSLTLSTSAPEESAFTPSSAFLAPELQKVVAPGELWLLSAFTPRYAATQISLGLAPGQGLVSGESKFDLSLTAGVVRADRGPLAGAQLYEALPRQAYSVGASVGYAGFRLGANVRAEQGAYYDGFGGYDVGISYSEHTWSTSLMFSEYRQGNTYLLGAGDPLIGQSYFALEFGAAYNLNPWLKFVGSFRWYEDAQLFWLDPNGLNTTRLFYLGTNVNF
ncbi:MAG TPA: hypothetical protein VD713_06480 [Sphingomonadales bacterium]|nr:hypothetical protein [Sphingomonadales bacterium]